MPAGGKDLHLIKILVAALDDTLPDMLCTGIGRDPALHLMRCRSAEEAIQMAGESMPDVIVLDLRLDGMEHGLAIAGLNRACGAAVVAMGPAMGSALQAVNAGAVDFIHLPVRGSESDCRLFAIDAVARLKVAPLGRVAIPVQTEDRRNAIGLIAIAAAQGGLVQLACVLKGLPPDSPPVLVMQRKPALSGDYLSQLGRMTGRKAVIGENGMELSKGTVTVIDDLYPSWAEQAEGRFLMRVEAASPVKGGWRANDFFRSVARSVGREAAGISLSGQGANGLVELAREGGLALLYSKNALLGQPGATCHEGILEMAVEDMAQEVLKRL